MRSIIVTTSMILLSIQLSTSQGQDESSKLLKPFNVPVNTESDEDDPHIADGGLTLYWTSNKAKKDDIYFARRRSINLAWPSKGAIVEDYVSTTADDRSVFATQGRYPHYLFFATKKDEKTKNYDLYVAVRHDVGKAWSAPTPVMNVNTEADELFPWITADGKSLYFSRKTRDGWRTFVTRRVNNMGPQGWGDPEQLEFPPNYHHVTVTVDGKTMYMQGPLEGDRTGLFISQLEGTTWSKPTALDGLNHPMAKLGDRSPSLTRDGRLLYYSSDRPGGKGGLDLWGIPLAELMKKK